jgi:ParB family chromosome partitioning protein
MVTLNRHRNPLTPLEEADALFAAREAGAAKTRIRKSTGLKAAQVNAALAAAELSGDPRDTVTDLDYDLTLENLAILAEFQDDAEALARLVDAASYSDTLEHHAQRLRLEREERAEHERLRAQLESSGITITDTLPPGAQTLINLRRDGNELTAESHAACPGRGAFFRSYDLINPVHYCADPDAHGHTLASGITSWAGSGSSSSRPGGPAVPGPGDSGQDAAAEAAARRLVIQGNRAFLWNLDC